MKAGLTETELIIYGDFSENYKNQQQNDIESAYFGHSTFSLFTACVYYRSTDDNNIIIIIINNLFQVSKK